MRGRLELAAALVAFSTFASAAPTPLPQEPPVTLKALPKQYDCSFVQANGNPAAFPDPSKWLSADEIWDLWEDAIRQNNIAEFDDIESGLQLIKETLVDYPQTLGLPELKDIPGSVFVAKAAQESTFRVNPPCTWAGTTNCGILQGPQGSAKWDRSRPESLKDVVRDAIEGKNDSGGGYSDGFQAALQKAKTFGDDAVGGLVGIATRLYNSGLNELNGKTLAAINLNQVNGPSTPGYVSDMLNILTGWVNSPEYGSFAGCGGAAPPAANVVAGRR